MTHKSFRRIFVLLSVCFLAPQPLVGGTITYEYDALDRLIQVSYGEGTVVQYSYDPAGNRTQRVVGAVSATTLRSGQPVSGLSGVAGSEQLFQIEVPAGRTDFRVEIWGGSGDADLYVRFGAPPTLGDADCIPWLDGNEESCVWSDPEPGVWYIMIHGYGDFSELSLQATFTPALDAQCGPEEDYAVTVGPQPGTMKEVTGCRSISVESGVLVPATSTLRLVAHEQIRFQPGFRVASGGQLSARIDSSHSPTASLALSPDAGHTTPATSAQLSGGANPSRTPEGIDALSGDGGLSGATTDGSPASIPGAENQGSTEDEPTLPAPLGLSALAGDASVALHWQPVAQADGYSVYWSRNPGIHPYTAASYDGFRGGLSEPRVLVNDLQNDAEYVFVVTASQRRLESPPSAEVTAIPEAGPVLIAGRYRLDALDAPTVVDLETGLEWQRCALGQQWDGAGCTGLASTYSHAEAQQTAAAFNGSRTPEQPAWRMPEVGELQGLVYCTSGVPAHFPEGLDTGCWGSHGIPTLEPTVFPTGSAAGGWFWSGSTHSEGQAWGLDFDRGTAHPYQVSAFSGVRLVRPAAPDLD